MQSCSGIPKMGAGVVFLDGDYLHASPGANLFQLKLPSFIQMVLSRDHVVQKRKSCEVVGSDQFSQGDPGLCWGSSGFSDCSFDISWPLAHLSSSTPAIRQW